GIFDGKTYDEIQKMYPEIHEERMMDKFHFRYPDGESYQDLIERLEPLIMELARESNILVVSHAAIIRCLLGYFLDIPTGIINFFHIYILISLQLELIK
ncbi:hypothetical protein L9F63_027599, partial [Diploptera punctata]